MMLMGQWRLISAGIIGLVLLALAWSWHDRGRRNETLAAQLDTCHSQRDGLAASAEGLKDQLARQNEAVSKWQENFEAKKREAEMAAQRAANARQSLNQEIARIMALTAPEGEVDQCRAARDLLTRP
ncbi:MAG: hypothetical protein DCC73_11340 [Proteobacteria bacterium]|nr:MAG: hypothetical protein DCC73_11340 [Pseudomonadota bacterium]